MPFARPSLTELIAQVKSDLRGRLSLAGPLVRRAMADVLSTVIAGAVHMLHGHLDWLSKQFFVKTADAVYLYLIGAFYGLSPEPASFAIGNVIATGTNGSVIPVDALLSISDVEYKVTAARTIAGGTATVPVRAVLAGAAGDLSAGVTLSFESPIAGVNADTLVDADGLVGFDQESVEDFRTRLMAYRQRPPEGGDADDYVKWAREVAGVTRAWSYPTENGLGTVVVRFVMDARTPTIFPDSSDVAAVQTHLQEQRPITAEVTAAAPTPLAVNFTIHLVPDTAGIRAAVQAELGDLIFRDGAPGDGIGFGTILHSRIATAIGVAPGIGDYTLTAPSADVVPTLGALPQMGSISWV